MYIFYSIFLDYFESKKYTVKHFFFICVFINFLTQMLSTETLPKTYPKSQILFRKNSSPHDFLKIYEQ